MTRPVAIAIFCIALLEIFSVLPYRPLASEPERTPPPPYVSGILHVHSVHSDGGGTIAEIAEAAKVAGHKFVVVTDHNTTAGRREGFEKSYDGTDAFVEMEATTPAGHCLVFNTQTDAARISDEALVTLAWQHFLGREAGSGFFIATAHPSHVKNPWSHLDRFPEGIEVMNFDAMWQRQLSESLLDFGLTVALMPLNQYLSALRFFQPYGKDLSSWDGMNSFGGERHFGFLGHDTHSNLKISDGVAPRWPDYAETFRLASNIVYYDAPLPENFDARKRQLYRSIRDGRLAIVFQSIHPFPGNDWRYECDNEIRARAGQAASFTRGRCRFVVETPPTLPFPRILRLYRNGNLVQEVSDVPAFVTLPADTDGSYRLEIWVKARTALRILLNRPVPYVFYNPIRLR